MHIKSIVLDGFKSYAQRTEVNGFDPFFNAITGLNGSGKSNILDGICFLLGITNLTHVRAGSLQELVYKNGQAGVTKATVSITFDNTDKKQSPLGYEQYDELTVTRQVVVGGRNKYLVNGSNANNTRVQDLFRSVQLNVNNPHFLIMQGRITKVLNMKPPEILSMLEEAAGTRLYESKKENARNTIEKKDAKLREIDTILNEEITPTLMKLKEERSSYLEYQKIIRELEHITKLCIAYQFICAEETKSKSAEEQTAVEENVVRLSGKVKENEKRMVEIDSEIVELEKKRDLETGGALKKLENDLAEKQKNEAKFQSALANKKEGLKAEEKKLKDLNKRKANEDNVMQSKKKEMEKLHKELELLKEKSKKDQEALAAAQKHMQAVNAGLARAADGGQDATLGDQLISAKTEVSNAETQLQQSTMTLQHAKDELKKKSSELQSTEQTYRKDKQVHDAAAKEIAVCEAEINKSGYEEGKVERLRGEKKKLMADLNHIRDKLAELEIRYPQLSFEYKDPENNFNRASVHGLVIRLVSVKNREFCTALEVAAGGRLYNVVVDTEKTGKKLVEKGQLKRRYTIIPLNQITSHPIENSVTRLAEQQVGKENVRTALSLVEYEDGLKAAMEYVFGNFFVCKDMNSAKKITFDKRISKKTVTMDGDSFDPAGLLSGGARQVTESVLQKVAEAKQHFDDFTTLEQNLAQLERELKITEQLYARWYEVKQRLALKQQDLQTLEERLRQSSHGQRLTEIETLKATVVEQENLAKEAKDVHNKATKRVAELEYKLKNADAEKDREMKAAKSEMDQAKKVLDASAKTTKEKEQLVETTRLELEELEKEAGSADAQAESIREAMEGYQKQIEELMKSCEETLQALNEGKEAVSKHKELLSGCNKGIAECHNNKKSLQNENHTIELELNELKHKITKNSRDAKEAANLVENMLAEYSWIADERKFFGVPNSIYDFTANDPREAQRRRQKLTETRDKLSKNVNMRAMNMLGNAEEQYAELMKKRKIVLNDKKKIEAVIAELDEKKKEALKKAYEQVTKDFGSIFSTLLPGTKAKLVAPEGMTILDGLEFKVAFGDVWKESLSELSGGQRSLVALSLILSLLLFKPAPLYILDEVDAALDLSHTQNIGQMLRTHFRHSQFIVVSLKDGMFNNANVLFRTKFADGLSTVSRVAVHNGGGGGSGDDAGGKRRKK